MGFAFSDLKLSSDAFDEGGPIPARHTGDGEDLPPALSWKQAPAGTKAFAIICHDPYAPLISGNGTYGFVHWVLYNIPGDVQQLDDDSVLPSGPTLWQLLEKTEPHVNDMNRLVGQYER